MSPVYKRKDHYYKKAKEQGLASRAHFKLEEIDQQHNLLKPEMRIVDLGCAPGGWLQYIAKKIGPQGQAVGIDLLPLKATLSPNMTFIQGDATRPEIQEQVIQKLDGLSDLVVSDLSPNLSGIHFRDCYLSYELALIVLSFAKKVLKPAGSLVIKIFPGEDLANYKKELGAFFGEIKTFVPKSTRKGSSEIYLIAKGFKDS